MRDEYTIDYRDVKHNGQTWRVSISPDYDSCVNDADCYSEADIAAFKNDEWWFVTVDVDLLADDGESTVTYPSVHGTMIADDCLGGVEYGAYVWNEGTEHETSIGIDQIATVYPGPDLIANIERAMANADRELAEQSYLWS